MAIRSQLCIRASAPQVELVCSRVVRVRVGATEAVKAPVAIVVRMKEDHVGDDTYAYGGVVDDSYAYGGVVDDAYAYGGVVDDTYAYGGVVDDTYAYGGVVDDIYAYGGVVDDTYAYEV